jgi:hypothetical protein
LSSPASKELAGKGPKHFSFCEVIVSFRHYGGCSSAAARHHLHWHASLLHADRINVASHPNRTLGDETLLTRTLAADVVEAAWPLREPWLRGQSGFDGEWQVADGVPLQHVDWPGLDHVAQQGQFDEDVCKRSERLEGGFVEVDGGEDGVVVDGDRKRYRVFLPWEFHDECGGGSERLPSKMQRARHGF